MARKSSEKQSYWQDIVNRQASSGLSIRAFCRREHVSEASFYMWRRKLRERKRGEGRSSCLNRGEGDAGNGREFIPLSLLDASGALEVIHPLGYRVRITGEVNVTSLERTLDVLDGRKAR